MDEYIARQKQNFEKDRMIKENIELTKINEELIGKNNELIKINIELNKKNEELIKKSNELKEELIKNNELTEEIPRKVSTVVTERLVDPIDDADHELNEAIRRSLMTFHNINDDFS
jgi:hypothetical protein